MVAQDDETGLRAVIAIHSTLLGPALCSTRFHPCLNEKRALDEAVMVAQLNTYKAAMANIPFGGACGVLIDPGEDVADRRILFEAYGRLIDRLNGHVVATEDLGTHPQDMDVLKTATPFACGGTSGGTGFSSYFTSLGVLRGIEALVRRRFKTDSLRGVKVLVYGVGVVGYGLCEMLHMSGAELMVADTVAEKAEIAAREFNGKIIEIEQVYDTECDIFSPCGDGWVLDGTSIPRLQAKCVAGSANNQLIKPDWHGRMLHERSIDYAPDFAVNAGGLYANACEVHHYDAAKAAILTNGIYETIERVLYQSDQQRQPSQRVAMIMVREKLRRARSRRIMQHL